MKRVIMILGLLVLAGCANSYKGEMLQCDKTLEACKDPITSNTSLSMDTRVSYINRIDATQMSIREALKEE